MSRKALGRWGESIAARHLQRLGYHIVERNWHTRQGELDLITRLGDEWVFVEVKTRASERFGPPEEAITRTKARRLLRAAWAYLEAHDLLQAEWRLDVIAVEGDPAHGLRRLAHYERAIAGDLEP